MLILKDELVQKFFKTTNLFYYIVEPDIFIQEYCCWWQDRGTGRALSLEWTCLLVVICACSAQGANRELREKLVGGLGENPDRAIQTVLSDC